MFTDVFFSKKSMLGSIPERGPIPPVGDLVRRTMKMAWPAIIEQFLVSLVSFIDTVMVSVLGSYAIAAVGLCGQPRFITLIPFFGLNVAVSALVARRKGQGDRDSANRILLFSLKLAVLLTVIISVAGVAFADDMIRFAGSQPDTHPYAVAYFRIVVGGMAFNVFSLVINAAQRGAGNTMIAMKTNLTSNLINLVLNYCLIGGHFGFPALGVRGDAIATVSGSVVAMVMSFASIFRKDGFLYLFYGEKGKRKIDRFSLQSMWKVGSASLLEQMFLRIGFMTYAIIVAHLGTVAFAAHQIGMNIISLSFSLGNGLSIAAVALVGESLGKKRPDLARMYGRICQRFGLIFSLTIAACFLVAARDIFRLFSDEQVILDYGSSIMPIIAVIVILQIAQVIFSGCLRGAGDTKAVALISLISVTFIRPFSGWLFVYPLQAGLVGAWFGILVDQFMRFILTFTRYRSGKWLDIVL
ncbi:MAG: MATE family efflux transporter [Sphaerochaetaceae bacterium]|jgi:putative MATE family efflux protein